MIPLRLKIENFQAHGKTEINFESLDKITLVVGRKGDNDKVSNGAGKSSIFDSITWIVFEHSRISSEKQLTTRDLVRDDQKGMRGILEFVARDGNVYRIYRKYTIKGNKMELSFHIKNGDKWRNLSEDGGKRVTQKKIVDILGYDFDIFENSVLCKQHEVAGIADNSGQERLAVVKKLLQLDIWTKRAEAAKKHAESIEDEIEEYSVVLEKQEAAKQLLKEQKELRKRANDKLTVQEHRIDSQKTKVERVQKDLDEHNKILGALEELKNGIKSRDEQKEGLSRDLRDYKKRQDDAGKKVKALEEEKKQKTERIRIIERDKPDKEKLTNDYRTLSKSKSDLQDKVGQTKGLLEATMSQGRTKKSELEEFRKLGTGSCPTCFGDITNSHCEDVEKKFEHQLQQLRNRAKEHNNSLKEQMALLEEAGKKLDKVFELQELYNELVGEKNTITERLNAIQELSSNQELAIRNYQAEIEASQKELERLTKENAAAQQKLDKAGGSSIVDKHKSLVSELKAENAVLDKYLIEKSDLVTAANVAKAKIDEYQALIDSAKEVVVKIKPLRKKAQLYRTLQKDCMKTIPTMILENSASRIEEEVNRCLSTLSDGFSIEIVTQHKNKTNDNIKEVFDLIVTQGNSVRAYQLLSGGEKFRVAFALRIALSIILSQETGVQIGAMFYDEPFNDLDEDGLDKIQEIFVYLSSMFEHQLAITHQTRLKDAFNDVLVIEKRPEGSTVLH